MTTGPELPWFKSSYSGNEGEELAGYVALVRMQPLYVVVLAPEPRAVAEREAGRGKSDHGPAGRSSRWTGCCGRRRRGRRRRGRLPVDDDGAR
ncbi:DUF397 domain-containing protein [Streptomyces sp. NBC_01320]|uniref:DUF397 domain-containing protein n=1 Tax=Streptomyces sp. NBC_01320 TaxID=2903824 RepID=UPI003FA37D44